MYEFMNWLCLICVTFLVLDIMVYFCKDAIKIMDNVEKTTVKPIKKTSSYVYEDKIAK